MGSLLAWDEVVAKTQATGSVLRLYVDLGDAVRAGQPLAELDRREADLGLDQLQADLLAARENLARARATADGSRANLQRIRASHPALAADVDRARADAEWKQLELDRNRELAAKQLIATRDVDLARAQSTMAQAQLRGAETALAQHAEQVQAAEAPAPGRPGRRSRPPTPRCASARPRSTWGRSASATRPSRPPSPAWSPAVTRPWASS